MTWFHLSGDPALTTITHVEPPTMAHGESDTPRFCVSPSVSQCVLGLSEPAQLYVYEVDVTDPDDPDTTVIDATLTCEKWITQGVLNRHNGVIPLRLQGPIQITQDDLGNLKNALRGTSHASGVPHDHKLWKIDENGIRHSSVNGSSEILNIIAGGEPYVEPPRPQRQTVFISE